MTPKELARIRILRDLKALDNSHSRAGIWHVRGEDPNCDMGGCHTKPSLGYFEGMLSDVLEYALNLNDFWEWGAGGDIEEVFVRKIDANARRTESRIRQAELQVELAEIEKELQ